MDNILKILKKEVPSWIKAVCYAVMLVETVIVVIIYHKPDLFFEIIIKII